MHARSSLSQNQRVTAVVLFEESLDRAAVATQSDWRIRACSPQAVVPERAWTCVSGRLIDRRGEYRPN